MKSTLLTFFAIASMIFSTNIIAQTVYSDATSGFSVTIPESWTQEAFESGELAMRATYSEGTAFYDVNLKKLEEGQTAYDYLLYLEGFMADAGYSENYVEADKRSFTGEDAKPYNADDLACGVYTKKKNDVDMIQSIILFRSGVYLYMTIATYPATDAEKHADAMTTFNSTFKVAE